MKRWQIARVLVTAAIACLQVVFAGYLLSRASDRVASCAVMAPPPAAWGESCGTFEGIGAMVSTDPDGRIRIAATMPGSPALGAGLRANDEIVAVDGQPVTGQSLYSVVERIRGPQGTLVTLTIEQSAAGGARFWSPSDVTITRACIDVPAEMREFRR